MSGKIVETVGSYMERKGYGDASGIKAPHQLYPLSDPFIVEVHLLEKACWLQVRLAETTHSEYHPFKWLTIPIIGRKVAEKYKVLFNNVLMPHSERPTMMVMTLTPKSIDSLVHAVRKFDKIFHSPKLEKAEIGTRAKIVRSVEALL